MLGLFSTLDLAKRAMQTQMTGVEVAGQNISNVNTTGYTRQRVNITESLDVPTSVGMEGTGAQVTSIDQVVDNLLNGQIQSSNSDLGFQQGRQTALQIAQDSLDEFLTTDTDGNTSGSGLSSDLNSLMSAFNALSTSPTSTSVQQSVIGAAQWLAATFNQVSGKFSDLKTSLNSSLTDDVASANKFLSQIASLNAQISNAQANGGNANDLVDQREQAVENLASLTNITTSTDSKGEINITIGGQSLVSGRTQLDSLQTYDAGSGQLLVQTASGGADLTLSGGSMQGTIDARDNDLAKLQTQFNSLASNLISAVNTIHSAGYSASGTTGQNFFTGTDASDIAVNSTLVNNPSLIQTSGPATASGDNSVAFQLAQLASATQSGLNNETFTNFYTASVQQLGTALSDANTQVTNQQSVSDMLSSQRGSVSGVNLDEEMTNLMSFQQAYTASAELLKTVDDMLQTTLAMKT